MLMALLKDSVAFNSKAHTALFPHSIYGAET